MKPEEKDDNTLVLVAVFFGALALGVMLGAHMRASDASLACAHRGHVELGGVAYSCRVLEP